MDLRNAERYLERTLQITQRLYDKHIERELTLDGFSQRLSQLADALYLGFVVLSFPVCMYGLNRTLPVDREQPVSISSSSLKSAKASLSYPPSQ